ncbi:MAG: 16S rRNA (cytosine(967)-C(5))-methyltransferase RsmB [Phascolarctobacterium sp.]|nr:16S rRNA (cytosine(967)-C(5))-methyltransferase RsmB [Candidatus Phascolarctobacterium caballi]
MLNARGVAVKLVTAVMDDGAYTNIELNKCLRSSDFDDKDRRFLTELVYGTVKSCNILDWYLNKLVNCPIKKIEPLVLNVLRVAVFQLLYLERVPAAAVVDEAVKLAKIFANPGAAQMVNGVLRNFLRKKNQFVLPDNVVDRMALTLWHPRFLVKKWLKYYGVEDTEKLCIFNNEPASLSIRVNTLQITRDALIQELKDNGVEAKKSTISADGIILEKHQNLKNLYDRFGGKFYIQDESSMLVAELLAPEQGQKVLDLCAAPGGKTTHLAQLMQDKGEIIACDIYPHKLELIKNNAQQLGINIIKTQLNDATVLNTDFVDRFDAVLVDAPCSGLGVLRHRAEIRWRRTQENLKVFPPLQTAILTNAAQYVHKDGFLVYSTCTIEQSENHYIVTDFLQKHSNFHLISERQLLPQTDNTDGFYLAKMQRIG